MKCCQVFGAKPAAGISYLPKLAYRNCAKVARCAGDGRRGRRVGVLRTRAASRYCIGSLSISVFLHAILDTKTADILQHGPCPPAGLQHAAFALP